MAADRCACGLMDLPAGYHLVSTPAGDHGAVSCRRVDKPAREWSEAAHRAHRLAVERSAAETEQMWSEAFARWGDALAS